MFGKKVVKTMIVSEDSRKKVGSAVGRAAVGAMLLGPVGLLAGATAKNKHTTTFLVEYNDGSRETKEVKNNSSEYKEYCKYLVM